MSGINVGELFVDLGIKGSEKTLGAITGVKKGLSETASVSLEAKAGIIAAIYAFERLFATSAHMGTGLTNLNAVLGTSTLTLQQYEYAGRQVGLANQEVDSSFKALQATMTKTLMGEGAPKGLARVSLLTGGLTAKDMEHFAKEPQMLIQKLQEYAGKEKNAGLRNEVLKSFNLSDGMIAGLTRGAFNPEALTKAPTYSEHELGALDRANIAWGNLGNKIQLAVGHLNAQHGSQLVKDLTTLTDATIHLTQALITLGEKVKIFEVIGHGLTGMANTVKLINELSDKIIQGKESKKGDLLYVEPGQEAMPGVKDSPAAHLLKSLSDFVSDHLKGEKTIDLPPRAVPAIDERPTGLPLSITPTPPRLNPTEKKTPQDIKITQTFHYQHDGKNSQQNANDVKTAVKQAHNQLNQGQGA